MTISHAQLLEGARLLNQMFRDSLNGWSERHFTIWRS